MTETEWHDIFAGETAAPHSTGAVERKDTEDEATSKDADAAPPLKAKLDKQDV